MRKFLSVFFILILTAAPVAMSQMPPSGKPEVTIPGVTQKQVVSTLSEMMIACQFTIKEITEYTAVYNRTMKDKNSILAFGTQMCPYPELRASYATIETDAGIRVIATVEMVSNPNTNSEYKKDYSADPETYKVYHQVLENLRAKFTTQQ
jgi:hypothetical protein